MEIREGSDKEGLQNANFVTLTCSTHTWGHELQAWIWTVGEEEEKDGVTTSLEHSSQQAIYPNYFDWKLLIRRIMASVV